MNRITLLLLISLALILPACHEEGHEHGHDHGHGHSHGADSGDRPQELKLTPRFSDLLRREMLQIESGMARLLGALARGESERAAGEAEKIRASFILEQSLSKEEMKTLGELLPAEFIRLDADFHKSAGRLAKAARAKDFAAAQEEYGRMSASCGGCHARFARDKFPGFAK